MHVDMYYYYQTMNFIIRAAECLQADLSEDIHLTDTARTTPWLQLNIGGKFFPIGRPNSQQPGLDLP